MTALIKSGDGPHLLCFGLGFSAQALAGNLRREGWSISGTCREEERTQFPGIEGVQLYQFNRKHPLAEPETVLSRVTDLLVSVPPDSIGDPTLDGHGAEIAGLTGLRWVGYLSTTGVYGDTGGATVDESAAVNPSSDRSRYRALAERRWLDLHRFHNVPVHIFRLAGIYGPGRNVFGQIRAGRARRIDMPGRFFSRIHVDDIAAILRASMARPHPGAIYNVCDDEPAPQSDVVAHACRLLQVEPPPLVPLEEAAAGMSEMALSFWQDNRRVDNGRIKKDLAVELKYPDYRAGLEAVLKAETDG